MILKKLGGSSPVGYPDDSHEQRDTYSVHFFGFCAYAQPIWSTIYRFNVPRNNEVYFPN